MHPDSPYIKLAPWSAVQCHFAEYIHKNSDLESEIIVISLKYDLLYIFLNLYCHTLHVKPLFQSGTQKLF